MAKIEIPAGGSYQDIINATFLYIDSVTAAAGVQAKVFFENGQSEVQDIVAGSKFKMGPNGERIEKVIFINPSAVVADIEYRYSIIFGYDENRLVGDITALTRFDNLTLDGNRFAGGYDRVAGGSTLYSMIMFWNPPGSGVNTFINVMRLAGYGSPVAFDLANATTGMFDLGVQRNKELGSADSKTRIYSAALASTSGLSIFQLGALATDLYGSNTALDLKNAPYKLVPGGGILFRNQAVNTGLTAFCEFWEEVI